MISKVGRTGRVPNRRRRRRDIEKHFRSEQSIPDFREVFIDELRKRKVGIDVDLLH